MFPPISHIIMHNKCCIYPSCADSNPQARTSICTGKAPKVLACQYLTEQLDYIIVVLVASFGVFLVNLIINVTFCFMFRFPIQFLPWHSSTYFTFVYMFINFSIISNNGCLKYIMFPHTVQKVLADCAVFD